MTVRDEVLLQLRRELEQAVHAALFAFDPDLPVEVCRDLRFRQALEWKVDSLLADDDQEAAQAAIDVMTTLWPHADPELVGRADWWSTPLGQAVARTTDHDQATAVTRSVAAAILGVHIGTVDQLAHRGTIARHPDGGIVRADVLRYLHDRRR